MAPRINRKDLPNTTVKVGQPVKFNVNVEGEPPPEVTWELAGKTMSSDKNLTIQNPDYLSKFVIAKAQRSYSGKYKITARNSSGVDEAEVDLLVLGKLTST